jgi:hypothetical protein
VNLSSSGFSELMRADRQSDGLAKTFATCTAKLFHRKTQHLCYKFLSSGVATEDPASGPFQSDSAPSIMWNNRAVKFLPHNIL